MADKSDYQPVIDFGNIQVDYLDRIEQFILDAGSDSVQVFGGSFEGGIQAQQIPDELAPCILAILESGESVNNYLEIGAAAGGTAFLFNHFFHPDNIVLIDDNRHPKAHVRPYILRDVPREEIIGDSHADGTAAALGVLGLVFDVIVVDGDHAYTGVKKDVEIYRELIRPGGFLILHDSSLPDWGVIWVVKELKEDPGMEFIAEYVSQKHAPACGLALFRKVKNEG
jgi:predicted O-methyltransferase YrrM